MSRALAGATAKRTTSSKGNWRKRSSCGRRCACRLILFAHIAPPHCCVLLCENRQGIERCWTLSFSNPNYHLSKAEIQAASNKGSFPNWFACADSHGSHGDCPRHHVSDVSWGPRPDNRRNSAADDRT